MMKQFLFLIALFFKITVSAQNIPPAYFEFGVESPMLIAEGKTTSQKLAIDTSDNSKAYIVFDSDLNELQVNYGTGWVSFSGFDETANYSLSGNWSFLNGLTANPITMGHVRLNGLLQDPFTDYHDIYLPLKPGTVALLDDIPNVSDDETFASVSATEVPSTRAIKNYVDANSGAIDGIVSTGTIAGDDKVIEIGGTSQGIFKIETNVNEGVILYGDGEAIRVEVDNTYHYNDSYFQSFAIFNNTADFTNGTIEVPNATLPSHAPNLAQVESLISANQSNAIPHENITANYELVADDAGKVKVNNGLGDNPNDIIDIDDTVFPEGSVLSFLGAGNDDFVYVSFVNGGQTYYVKNMQTDFGYTSFSTIKESDGNWYAKGDYEFFDNTPPIVNLYTASNAIGDDTDSTAGITAGTTTIASTTNTLTTIAPSDINMLRITNGVTGTARNATVSISGLEAGKTYRYTIAAKGSMGFATSMAIGGGPNYQSVAITTAEQEYSITRAYVNSTETLQFGWSTAGDTAATIDIAYLIVQDVTP